MSLYPSAPDIFVDRTGADPIASSDPNNAYDGIENIENFLGASGEPQSKMATLINAFRYMFQPLPQCSWIDADTIGIAPCSAVLFNTNNFVIKRNTAAITCCLSLALDTGSEIANAWYELYLLGDGSNTNYTAKFVLQGSVPSGMTYYKKINSFRNDGSSDLLKVYQQNDFMMWDIPIMITTNPSAGSWSAALACTGGMPSISTLGVFGLKAAQSGNAPGIWIRPNGSVWGSAQAMAENGISVDVAAASNGISGQRKCFTDSLQQIQHFELSGNNVVVIDVEGYYIAI